MRATIFVLATIIGAAACPRFAWAQPDTVPRTDDRAADGRAADLSVESGFQWTIFVDTSIVSYGRDVRFGDAPDNNAGASAPHLGIGIGVWFGNGIPGLLDRFGVRFGYITGGDFGIGDSPDLATATQDEFNTEVIELGFLDAWDEFKPRPTLLYRSWEFFGTAPTALTFRGATIPAGERYKQRIATYGVSLPITLIDDLDWAIRDQTPTLGGLALTYRFIQVGVETLIGVEGTVPNHVLMLGTFVDWGITDWLRWSIAFDAGLIVGHSESFIANIRSSVEFVHIPPYWLGNNFEIIMRFEAETTTTDLGDRYLVNPQAEPDETGTFSWINFSFRFGIRVWF